MEFILESTIKGIEESAQLPKIDPVKAKAMSIAETRKSLPVFTYRQQLLDAIKVSTLYSILSLKYSFIFCRFWVGTSSYHYCGGNGIGENNANTPVPV